MTKETVAQLTSIDERTPLNHQHQCNNTKPVNARRLKSNLRNVPNRSLIAGNLCLILVVVCLVLISKLIIYMHDA